MFPDEFTSQNIPVVLLAEMVLALNELIESRRL